MSAAYSQLNKSDLEAYESESEAIFKLLNLEKDLMQLKSLLVEVKKIKQCCSYADELKEINASRKK